MHCPCEVKTEQIYMAVPLGYEYKCSEFKALLLSCAINSEVSKPDIVTLYM